MLKKENDGGHRKLACECRKQFVVDLGLFNMAEAAWDGFEDLDGILAGRADAMTAIEPGSNGQDDDHKGIAED